MDFNTLLDNINNNIIDNIYLLYGQENYLIEYTINQLRHKIIPSEYDAFNFQVIEGEKITFENIKNACNTIPFMNNYRLIVVNKLNNAILFDKDSNQIQKLLNYLKCIPKTTCIVFCVNGLIDKRKKLYRYLNSNATSVEFSILNTYQLKRWAIRYIKNKNKNINETALNLFISNCSNKLIEIKNELDKIIDYSGNNKTITEHDIQAITSASFQNNIFILVDSIGEKNYYTAMQTMNQLITNNENIIRILSMIARQFRILINIKLMLEQGYSIQQICKKLKLPIFIIKKYILQCKNFDIYRLQKLLNLCLQTDHEIKTGKSNAKIAVEMLIFEGCKLNDIV